LRKLLDMIVFVDESGDAGLKVESGSSPHFVVTLVVFNDNEEAARVDEHIAVIRQKVNLHKDFEFHFTKLSKNLRQHFLSEINLFDFKYFSFVIHKNNFDESLIKNSREFYKFAFKAACLTAKECLENATFVIDGQSSKEFRQDFEKHLKVGLNTDEIRRMKKMKMQDSHKNNLLQLADMICGSVAAFYRNDKYKTDTYYRLIKLREEKVEIFEKK
jgi:Protein of unknown function (DUF3800)